MLRYTGTFTGLPPVGVMRMLPVYEPAASVLEVTATVKLVSGVVLLAPALVESQLAPAVTCTVKETPAEPAALFTLMVLAAGLDPDCAEKVSEVGRSEERRVGKECRS